MTSENKNSNKNVPTEIGLQLELAVVDGKLTVTSLELSRTFGKMHKDVLKAIVNTTSKCSPEFSRRNFAPANYKDGKGESRIMYNLTRDGFSMVALGFNGVSAMAFKEAYIGEFNRMETVLSDKAQQVAQANLNEPELERPWSPEIEEILIGFWRFGKSDTQFFKRRERLELNKFARDMNKSKAKL